MRTQHTRHIFVAMKRAIVGVALAIMSPLAAGAEQFGTGGRDLSSGTHEVALSALRAESGPIRLMGIQNSAQVSFPVSTRQRIQDAELSLHITNSIALTNRSHMAIAVNDVVIGQLPFRGEHPETRARITVPTELIQPGYNKISFRVAQHSADNCEDPSAPGLWSEIDTVRSKISYTATLQTIKPSLAELPQLMDKRLLGQYNLTIATAGAVDNALVDAGGLVAQTAALARDYATLGIRHATVAAPIRRPKAAGSIAALPADLFAGGDGVLLGSREALEPWLDAETYALAADPLLALFPFGPQGERFVLVVTGATNDQVRQAADTLVRAYSTLPPTAKANLSEMTATAVNSRPTLQPRVRHAFTDFDFRTATRKGIHPEGMRLRFWVPADHFAYPNSKLNLSLHLAYGAGFGPQSVLNVFLNQHFEHAVQLAEPRGAVFYDYRVPIPVSSLEPGWNELEFRPSLTPQRAEGRCQPVYTENLLLTLFDDSSMESGDMQQLTQLPDLGLFGRTGFPFVGGLRDTPFQLALTGHDSGTLEAAWMLVGKLAQVNNAPVLGLRSVAPDKARGNTLVVGQLDKVPPALLRHSPLSRADWWQLGRAQPPAGGALGWARGADASVAKASLAASLGALLDQGLSGAWWQFGVVESATGDELDTESIEVVATTNPALKVSLGNLLDHSLLLTQFASSGRDGHSVVMVVANSADLLSRQMATLVDAPYWGQLMGGTVILGQDTRTVRNYAAPELYLVGNAGLRARLSHIFAGNPALAITVVAAGVLLLALLTWRWLVGYRRRQHGSRAD